MLTNYKPGAPHYPFPTAWPYSGIKICPLLSGQHETNPEGLGWIFTGFTRRKRPAAKKQIWRYNWTTWPHYTPPPPAKWTRLAQTAITRTWKEILTTPQRTAWATLASVNPVQNYYGTTKLLTGFGFFVRANWLYLYMVAIPGYPVTIPFNTLLLNAPASWPTYDPVALNSARITIPSPMPSPPPDYATQLWAVPTFLEEVSNYWVQVLIGPPASTITRRRQGPLTLDFLQTPEPPFWSPYRSVNGWLYNPRMKPGDTVTLASRLIHQYQWGEGPLTYQQVPIVAA